MSIIIIQYNDVNTIMSKAKLCPISAEVQDQASDKETIETGTLYFCPLLRQVMVTQIMPKVRAAIKMIKPKIQPAIETTSSSFLVDVSGLPSGTNSVFDSVFTFVFTSVSSLKQKYWVCYRKESHIKTQYSLSSPEYPSTSFTATLDSPFSLTACTLILYRWNVGWS
jgi:hypothetical protein